MNYHITGLEYGGYSQYGSGNGITDTDRHAIYGKRKEAPGGWNPSLTMGHQTRKEPAKTGGEYLQKD